MAKFDTYQEVTDRVIAALEEGAKPWDARWQGGGAPLRSCGQPYRGINILLLWMSSSAGGYAGRHWVTFKQAKGLGATVRKGERGTRIVFFKRLEKTEIGANGEEETRGIPMLRTYTVFNSDQVDDLPEALATQPIDPAAGLTRDQHREDALRSCGAAITEGGTRAFYAPAQDRVTMPDFERFVTGGDYLATLAHELCHWTGHRSRLDRDMRGTFGSADYAREELVAEMGAAFIGARLGIVGDHLDNHAAYLASWLKALRDDKRCIFRAAAKAQAAADLVLANAGDIAGAAAPASLAEQTTATADLVPAKLKVEPEANAPAQFALAF